MTRAEWDEAWRRTFHGVRVTNPDWDLHRAGIEATGLTRLHYGPRPEDSLGAVVGKFGLGLLKGVAMDWLKKLFEGKPGLLRTVAAVYIVAVVVLKSLGLDALAETLGTAVTWIGLLPKDIPVDPATAVGAILAAVALVRQFGRWIMSKPAA